MIKLCWQKNKEGKVIEYYYDMASDKLYVGSLLGYYATSKFKMTPAIACAIIGPAVTFSGLLFDKMSASVNLVFILVSLGLLCVGIFFINKSYDSSEDKKGTYIKQNIRGEETSRQEVRCFYRKGRKMRIGFWMFALFLISGMWFSSQVMYRTDRNVSSLILFYVCTYGAFIWIKMVGPIKNFQMFRKLKLDDKKENSLNLK